MSLKVNKQRKMSIEKPTQPPTQETACCLTEPMELSYHGIVHITCEISQNQEFFLIGSETMSHMLKKKKWEATGPTEKNKDNSVTKKSKNFVLQFTFLIFRKY